MSFNSKTIGQIESDLRSLSILNRKKYKELVIAAERAVLALRNGIQDINESADIPTYGALHSEVVLRPFLLACSAKQNKLIFIGLEGMQKLLSLQPIPEAFLGLVIGTLRIQAENNDNRVQLKILQSLLLAVSPTSIIRKSSFT